ncbi:MAG: hypothetical protein R8G66_29405 [Cytophagales bacterium]|nr:hypothetical protein [Cytophagales bacterium]
MSDDISEEELEALRNKVISAGDFNFKLWTEFENTGNWEDLTDDYANIEVNLMDGRRYVITLCTFKYFQTEINRESANKEVIYQLPSDLYVKELTRECVEQTISELLQEGDLEELLNESVFALDFLEPWIDCYDLEDFGDSLKAELEKELHEDHPLFEKGVEILAKRQDNDDILIEIENGQLALVHLTWSGKREQGSFPLTELYLGQRDFWKRAMKEQIQEYQAK